ncbi:MAG: VanZ family protein [Acidobacteriota bacterium]
MLFYMGVIFFLSSSATPEILEKAPDYVLHFLGYAFLAVLSVRALARGLSGPLENRSLFYSLLLSLTYAASDEWHQSFVPGRVASLADLLADALGIVAAAAVLFVVWRLGEHRRFASERSASAASRGAKARGGGPR